MFSFSFRERERSKRQKERVKEGGGEREGRGDMGTALTTSYALIHEFALQRFSELFRSLQCHFVDECYGFKRRSIVTVENIVA